MTNTEMTKSERDELGRVVRMRAKVAKADVDARKAELLADFEEALAAEYKFADERWAPITAAAQKAVAEADAAVAKACAEAGIPEEFRPSLSVSWYRRGENAAKDRRVELRKVATTRIDAAAKAAKLEVDRHEAALRGDLAARGLSSGEARDWLSRLPTAEELLPALSIDAVKAELTMGRHLTVA